VRLPVVVCPCSAGRRGGTVHFRTNPTALTRRKALPSIGLTVQGRWLVSWAPQEHAVKTSTWTPRFPTLLGTLPLGLAMQCFASVPVSSTGEIRGRGGAFEFRFRGSVKSLADALTPWHINTASPVNCFSVRLYVPGTGPGTAATQCQLPLIAGHFIRVVPPIDASSGTCLCNICFGHRCWLPCTGWQFRRTTVLRSRA
jgi:hypothetical protein